MSSEEMARLQRSPHGAKRIGPHQLAVTWSSGTHIFKDEPPYNEPLAGTAWTYCGYSPDVRVHLLLKNWGALFTGALLDDATGRVMQGGFKVVFSPDRQSYVAYEQPDGLDGWRADLLLCAQRHLDLEGI